MGVFVAAVAGERALVARRSLKVGLLTVLPVAIAVDLGQLFIGLVAPWHRIAVHVLFAIAFTLGVAVFLGFVSSKLAPFVASLRADGHLLSVDGIMVVSLAFFCVQTVFDAILGIGLAVGLDALLGIPLWFLLAGRVFADLQTGIR